MYQKATQSTVNICLHYTRRVILTFIWLPELGGAEGTTGAAELAGVAGPGGAPY